MPFNNIGPMELIIVLVIALLVIGPKRLPEVGKSLGKGMREFKDSISGDAPRRRRRGRRRPRPSTEPSSPADLASSSSTTIVEHARADAPNECCGMIASRDGEAVAVHRARNAAASPLQLRDRPERAATGSRTRSRTPGSSSARSTTRTRARTRSRRRPTSTSPARRHRRPAFPGTLYLIVGVKGPEPDLRLWSIVGNAGRAGRARR